MAAMLSFEESLAVLEAKFVDNGWAFLAELVVRCNRMVSRIICSHESAPRGLVALLQMDYGAESGRAGRAKMYRRIYGILWVSDARFATSFAHNYCAQSCFPFSMAHTSDLAILKGVRQATSIRTHWKQWLERASPTNKPQSRNPILKEVRYVHLRTYTHTHAYKMDTMPLICV